MRSGIGRDCTDTNYVGRDFIIIQLCIACGSCLPKLIQLVDSGLSYDQILKRGPVSALHKNPEVIYCGWSAGFPWRRAAAASAAAAVAEP